MSKARIPGWISVGLLPALNVLLAFLVSAILFSYLEINPLDAAKIMWTGAFGSEEGIGFTLYYATGFIFTGLAVAVAFHAGLFNIGGEGQAYIGGLGVGLVCLLLGDVLPFALLLPLAIIAGGLFGAAWAFIPAWLQARRGSHIVITTIMFNFIASAIMAYLLVEVFKPAGSMATESRVFAAASWLPKMSDLAAMMGIEMVRSPLNISFFWALICAVLVWLFIWHTRWGYEIRSVGASQSASAYAGIPYPRVVIITMLISGMLAGFFALNVLQGELHQIKLNFVEGFGFTGIAVALMGRNHPVGVILASLLFGFLYQGGAELSFEFGVDRNIVVVLQGLVILFCGALEHMLRPRVEQLYLALATRKEA
ncbi:ABC transporter permease [Aeromonas schubertii]|uniref:ABC transporter permease n=1 Tax=Aeromonas schubertii TaxID=652 RepID=A0ABS7VAW5_9GAMM|nr:ABC transporter permease [Aeromonas schubertii]KUE81150.1 sugar ABC transporter permease [Aeromonas schubertii]MBZ6066536.1 ABC transporter permease [Aeromonas schubertii]MBZ6073398.1 ABC transporter permease [Aeromonas schubertii]QCG49630.1 ABC transporter permease [Aeromonas schubertii]